MLNLQHTHTHTHIFHLFCSSQLFGVPELECALVSVEGQSIPGDSEKPTQLAMFLQGILHLAASTLNQLTLKVCTDYATECFIQFPWQLNHYLVHELVNI